MTAGAGAGADSGRRSTTGSGFGSGWETATGIATLAGAAGAGSERLTKVTATPSGSPLGAGVPLDCHQKRMPAKTDA
ncbi:hypothetical protein [Parvibaculum sp.]|uniref:hypothetical protein n=1 Tax=Parvibaculum sp. TaxID=2024848 RepID=UPI003FA6B953